MLTLFFLLLTFLHHANCFVPSAFVFALIRSREFKFNASPGLIRQKTNADDSNNKNGFRLNKCIPSLSRRGADDAIANGAVLVNGKPANSAGMRVFKGDVVKYNDKVCAWQKQQTAKKANISLSGNGKFVYLKYNKPKGVTCTCDLKDASNIINAGRFDLFPQRLFPVARLDKESTELILLTSDGRVNNALSDPRALKKKQYSVFTHKRASDEQLQCLRDGVVIKCPIQRDNGRSREVTVTTLPCIVERVKGSRINSNGNDNSNGLLITLTEGRNRQIRRMCEEVGLIVVDLHRTRIGSITINGLPSNQWSELTRDDMKFIQTALTIAPTSTN